MTTNPSNTKEFDINALVLMAYQLTGLKNANESTSSPNWASQASMAMNFLEVIIKDLGAQGPFVRSVEFYDLTTVAGQTTYTLPADTIELVGVGMYLQDGQTTGQTAVNPISREDYQLLSNKTAQGRPYQYYQHRLATQTVYLYPVPDSAGTITFSRSRLFYDSTTGQYTPDLERHWSKFLLMELSGYLAMASSLPESRVKMYKDQAEEAKKTAMAQSKQRVSIQMHIAHRTPWSRR